MDRITGTGQNTPIPLFASGPLGDYDSIHADPIIADVRAVRPAEYGIAWLLRAYAHGKHHQSWSSTNPRAHPLPALWLSSPASRSAPYRWGSKPHDLLPSERKRLVVLPNIRWA